MTWQQLIDAIAANIESGELDANANAILQTENDWKTNAIHVAFDDAPLCLMPVDKIS